MLPARLSKERVPAVYRRLAPAYDAWACLTETRARNRCLDLAAIRDGDSVLDFADASFDVLINNYLFDLLPQADFVDLLAGFLRVLKPGGRLAMVNMTVAWQPWQRLWSTIYRLNPAWLGGCRGIELSPFLLEAGFEVLRRELVSQMTFPSEVVLARRRWPAAR